MIPTAKLQFIRLQVQHYRLVTRLSYTISRTHGESNVIQPAAVLADFTRPESLSREFKIGVQGTVLDTV